jgi:MFS-type transporter involved in bile tolerance (Atg22 family)
MLYGKLGIKTGGVLMMAAFAAGMLALLHAALVWPGLILLAFGLGVYTTLLPQVTRRIFDSREYAAIWALIATAGSAGTFFANPLWGTIYDLTGSYALGLIGAALLLAAAIWAMLQSLKGTD